MDDFGPSGIGTNKVEIDLSEFLWNIRELNRSRVESNTLSNTETLVVSD